MDRAASPSSSQARDAAIPFKCLLRADQVTPAVASPRSRPRGAARVWIGAESGSQRILDAMEKGTRVEQIARARHGCCATRASRSASSCSSAIRAKRATTSSRRCRWCATCRPDDIGVSVSYPLPGTPFYERVKAQLGEKRNWLDSDDLAMMYSATYSPDFYRTLYALVHSEFGRGSPFRHVIRSRSPGTWLRMPLLRRRARALERAGAETPVPLLMPIVESARGGHPDRSVHVEITACASTRIVLYNPCAPFFTMPLGLVAIGSGSRSIAFRRDASWTGGSRRIRSRACSS